MIAVARDCNLTPLEGAMFENSEPGLRFYFYQTMPDPKAREAAIRANAKAWSQIYDGHSMVVLRRAIGSYDITADYARRKNTKVLYVQSPSDKLFDIALSPGYVSDMRKAGIDVTYVELPTNKGHMASHADAALWAPILGAFLKRLT